MFEVKNITRNQTRCFYLFIFEVRQSAQSPDTGQPYLMLSYVNLDLKLCLFSTDKFKVIQI
jgi:hypothetical protein